MADASKQIQKSVLIETQTEIEDFLLHQDYFKWAMLAGPLTKLRLALHREYKHVGFIFSIKFSSNNGKYMAAGNERNVHVFNCQSNSKIAIFWAADADLDMNLKYSKYSTLVCFTPSNIQNAPALQI